MYLIETAEAQKVNIKLSRVTPAVQLKCTQDEELFLVAILTHDDHHTTANGKSVSHTHYHHTQTPPASV